MLVGMGEKVLVSVPNAPLKTFMTFLWIRAHRRASPCRIELGFNEFLYATKADRLALPTKLAATAAPDFSAACLAAQDIIRLRFAHGQIANSTA
jgi:hypothetical protein